MKLYSCVQLLALPPRPPDRGSAPGPRWGHIPQTPIIGSRYRARHSPPQMLKPNSAYGREGKGERKGGERTPVCIFKFSLE